MQIEQFELYWTQIFRDKMRQSRCDNDRLIVRFESKWSSAAQRDHRTLDRPHEGIVRSEIEYEWPNKVRIAL
jgi:hypothetical protein